MNVTRLVLPALRASEDGSFAACTEQVDAALRIGAGGFLLFGGDAGSVADFTRTLRERFSFPILLAADLERGAGQQFRGLTPLPSPAALASLNDLSITREAGRITGSEARSVGIDIVFAPVADLDTAPENPIVATRSFGSDPLTVGKHVAAWVRGCLEGGALPCPKHFPGHGRTVIDSHVAEPVVNASRKVLLEEMQPFLAGFEAGAPITMSAHVRYPALDPESIASFSEPILRGLLREQLGFVGAVISDGLRMSGADAEGDPGVAALRAGCDLLLDPADCEETARALERSVASGGLAQRAAEALDRRGRLLDQLSEFRATSGDKQGTTTAASSADWARDIARRTITPIRGDMKLARSAQVEILDDDRGGPYALPDRNIFAKALAAGGARGDEDGRGTKGRSILLIFSDPRAYKGRAGLAAETVDRARSVCSRDPSTLVVLFSHPRNAVSLSFAEHVLGAWSGEPPMQQAAADYLRTSR